MRKLVIAVALAALGGLSGLLLLAVKAEGKQALPPPGEDFSNMVLVVSVKSPHRPDSLLTDILLAEVQAKRLGDRWFLVGRNATETVQKGIESWLPLDAVLGIAVYDSVDQLKGMQRKQRESLLPPELK